MSDVPPVNHAKIKLPRRSKIRIKTEDEFSNKQEALDYYRSYFMIDVFSYIPEVVTFLKQNTYAEFKHLVSLDEEKLEVLETFA